MLNMLKLFFELPTQKACIIVLIFLILGLIALRMFLVKKERYGKSLKMGKVYIDKSIILSSIVLILFLIFNSSFDSMDLKELKENMAPFAIFGFSLILLGFLPLLFSEFKKINKMIAVDGVVISNRCEKARDSESPDEYFPVFRYKVDGKDYEAETNTTNAELTVGETAEIGYNKENPEDICVPDISVWYLLFYSIVAGHFFIVLALIMSLPYRSV